MNKTQPITKKKLYNIKTELYKEKWRYEGHLVRRKKNKWGIKILNCRPFGDSRKRGRPAKRWRDEIVKKRGIIWHRETLDRRSVEESAKVYAQKWATKVQPT